MRILVFHKISIFRNCLLHVVKFDKRNVLICSARKMESAENITVMLSSDRKESTFSIDKTAYTVVKEGTAEVLFPNSHDVFYNPVQEFNRDISIAVLQQFINQKINSESNENQVPTDQQSTKDGVTIVECLAASGLRSIRYAKELTGVKKIICNDISVEAVESIECNVKYNNVQNIVESSHQDAALLLYLNRSFEKQFDIVDLDPYGSPSSFLDGAVQAVKDGGLLMVTCTDLAILCGNHSETCRAKYGASSLKSKCCHEIALRIVLQAIESHANRYGRYIIPLISISVDFYVRLFMIVKTSKKLVKASASKLAMVYQCTGCDVHTFQPLGRISQKGQNMKYSLASGPPVNKNCEYCGSSHLLGGPIWNEEIHDKDFVSQVISSIEEKTEKFNTSKRMIGLLSVVQEEAEQSPLYYHMDRLSEILHVQPPKRQDVWSAILNAGFQVSTSHANKASLKTNAPPHVIWDVMKTCRNKLKESEKKIGELKPNSVGAKLMAHPIKTEVSFELHENAQPDSVKKGVVRYQVNPLPNWGPKARARSSTKFDSLEEKRKRHQGKRKRNNDSDKQNELQPNKCTK